MKKIIYTALFLFSFHSIFALGHWKGNQRAVVILLEWSNFETAHTASEINEIFFDENKPSLKSFFKENAVGKFDINGDVMDWRKTTAKFDPKNGCNVKAIVQEAWKQFGADVKTANYDSDKNNKIDNLFIIHSGRIASDRVGPECMFTDFSPADHTIVFQVAGTGSIGNEVPIGFYVHEGGHKYFGFPDLYGDHYHGHYGIAMWGMMGLGAWGTYNQMPQSELFRFPGHFEPMSKEKIGWVKPRVVNQSQKVILQPVEGTADIVVIPTGSGANYYLEYRSKNGFSANHLGHGLLIWKNYQLVQADGRDDLNHGNNLGHRPLPPNAENFGDASDPFPGSLNITSYQAPNGSFKLEEIKQYPDHIEFNVVISKKAQGRSYQPAEFPAWDGIERL